MQAAKMKRRIQQGIERVVDTLEVTKIFYWF